MRCPTDDTWFLVFFFGGAIFAFWGGFELGKETGWRRPRALNGQFLPKKKRESRA